MLRPIGAALALACALLAFGVVAAGAATPSLDGVVAGLGSDQGSGGSPNPSDTQVAAGNGQVVEIVNQAVGIWDESGTTLANGTAAYLGQFVSADGIDRSGDDVADPRVVFDPQARRWYVSAFDVDRRETDLLVSKSADARGGWTEVAQASTGCPDQPRLGFSDSLITIGVDVFDACGDTGAIIGGEVIAWDKGTLLTGSAAAAAVYGPDASLNEITPVASLTPTATQYMVAVENDGTGVDLLTLGSTADASVRSTTISLDNPFTAGPDRAPQPGTSIASGIDVGDWRVQNAVWETGSLWLAATNACSSDASRSCARVLRLDTAGLAVASDQEIDVPGRFLFYPAVMPDGLGNVIAAYGYSSAQDSANVGYSVAPADGPFGAPSAGLAQAAGANLSLRWGDYSGIARDPDSPGVVWIAGQYADGAGDDTWGTVVARLGSSAPPPAPAPAPSPAAPKSGTTQEAPRSLSITIARSSFSVTRRGGREAGVVTVDFSVRELPSGKRVAVGAVSCGGTNLGTRLATSRGRFRLGDAVCAWTVPRRSFRIRILGKATVTADGLTQSLSFLVKPRSGQG